MSVIQKIIDYCIHPRKIRDNILYRIYHSAYGKKMDDAEYIHKMFKLKMGYELDLDNPETFNEKLQWLKLYDHNPNYVQMVDKYLAKDYVARIIGKEYIVPIYGVWDRFEDIDFEKLPNQFVLKTTHDCGGVVVCKDKRKLNYKETEIFLNSHLNFEYFYHCREWPYKQVKPRIIAEKYMCDSNINECSCLTDYKFFCFDGVPRAMFIATDRASKDEETKFDFYDMNFNHLPFTNGHPNSTKSISKPDQFDLMIELAKKLSRGIPQVRVDFYESDGKIYFGELTLCHWGGLVPFSPNEWDKVFGDWIILPKRDENE